MRVVLCVLVVCLAATGCGLMRQSMDIDYNDQRLNDGLEGVFATGSPAPLRDFTSWEWDEVHLFHEWTERTFIEETVGAPVIKSDIYESKASLLVFENNGEPVKAAGVSGDYLRSVDDRVSFTDDVLVQPWGGGFLQLTPPAG